ncbi:MAG: hypothetical protein GF333_04990 [Candidatus Omnitrophica bacterium]|nr:hypothetical protein [Candidatus Omnitrophota bacterium]
MSRVLKRERVWAEFHLADWTASSFDPSEQGDEPFSLEEMKRSFQDSCAEQPAQAGAGSEEPESTELPAEEAGGVREAAARLRAQAEKDAERIRAQAEQEYAGIKEDAYQEGLRQGAAEGERKAREAHRAAAEREIEQIRTLARQISDGYPRAIKMTQNDLVRLALEVAEKVIKDESQKRKKVVEGMIREGLRRVSEKAYVKVRVNPGQLDFVREKKEDFIRQLGDVERFECVPDESVDPGGCIIETPSGSVDMRIGKQVAEVRSTLIGEEENE